MRILIIGGTGGTGLEIIRQALGRHIEVTAAVRAPDKLGALASRIRVSTGDVFDSAVIAEAAAGTDAVLSSIGAPAGFLARGATTVYSKAAAALAVGLPQAGVNRLVFCTSAGVEPHDPAEALPYTLVAKPFFLQRSYNDMMIAETTIRSTELDWTLVRPGRLTTGPATGRWAVTPRLRTPGGKGISRADVATFMLDQINDTTWTHGTPTLNQVAGSEGTDKILGISSSSTPPPLSWRFPITLSTRWRWVSSRPGVGRRSTGTDDFGCARLSRGHLKGGPITAPRTVPGASSAWSRWPTVRGSSRVQARTFGKSPHRAARQARLRPPGYQSGTRFGLRQQDRGHLMHPLTAQCFGSPVDLPDRITHDRLEHGQHWRHPGQDCGSPFNEGGDSPDRVRITGHRDVPGLVRRHHRCTPAEHRLIVYLLEEPTEAERAAGRAAAEDGEQAAGVIFARLNPRAGLPGLAATIAEWHPDLVMSKAAEFAGGLAAERAGVPTLRVHPGMVHGSLWEQMAASMLSATRTEAGLPPDPAADRLIAAPQLSFFPTAIDSRPTAATVTRVKRPGLPVPQPVREPLIYVTLGSEIPKMPMFAPTARAAVEAARHTGYQVILSIGSADPAALGDLGGVEVARWVDQTEVLPRARVVISHGGAGTTLDALAAATPMITIPFFADQPYNADSLAAVEVGRTVRPGTDLASRLREALNPVLTEEPPGSARMADAVASLPDISAAISLLELHARP